MGVIPNVKIVFFLKGDSSFSFFQLLYRCNFTK